MTIPEYCRYTELDGEICQEPTSETGPDPLCLFHRAQAAQGARRAPGAYRDTPERHGAGTAAPTALRDPCPNCQLADLQPHGAKHSCPLCGYLQPCCNP